jgi:hypothetical protein
MLEEKTHQIRQKKMFLSSIVCFICFYPTYFTKFSVSTHCLLEKNSYKKHYIDWIVILLGIYFYGVDGINQQISFFTVGEKNLRKCYY